ncbi:MAG TPA: hypothetical protein DIU15_14905, partial [Deltaproteobacteria bacterium]|nr:hypothetical protein [Deltaproteobacteria bacterium]
MAEQEAFIGASDKSTPCRQTLAVYTGGQRYPEPERPQANPRVDFMNRFPLMPSCLSLGLLLQAVLVLGGSLLLSPGLSHAGSRVEMGLPLADPAPTGQSGLQARILF